MKPKLILASSSPRRKSILQQLGLRFTVDVSAYEEDMTLRLPPPKLAEHLALGKALTVAPRHPRALIVAADSILAFRGKVIGKPSSLRDAEETLKRLSGKTHQAITGVAVIDTRRGWTFSTAVVTDVQFRKISAPEIRSYVRKEINIMGRAGSYAIESIGCIFVKKITGDFFGVVGLPVLWLAATLRKCGISIL